MFGDHGNYEITYKASKIPVWNFDNQPESKYIIEADSKYDAEKKGEKFLKDQGYSYVRIVRVTLLKRTPRQKRTNHIDSNQTTNSKHSSVLLGAFVFLIALIVFIAQIIRGCSDSELNGELNGKYYFKDSYGTATTIVVDQDNTYVELEDGECVLHLTLLNPVGSSIHYYSYTGDSVDDIRFNKDYINMNRMGWIIIRLNFEDRTYINFEFVKE